MRVAALAGVLICACSPEVSSVMRPSSTPRSAVADAATILFVGHVQDSIGRGAVWTVYDENKSFRGELAAASAFETRVTPGRHTFCVDVLSYAVLPCTDRMNELRCFAGDFEPGKYYIAWFRSDDHKAKGHRSENDIRWVFPHPGSKTLDVAEIGDVPLFTPDLAAGQKLLDTKGELICKKSVPAERVNPASWGYDAPP